MIQMQVACMGGWCSQEREFCQRYWSDSPVLVERMCQPGQHDERIPAFVEGPKELAELLTQGE